MERRTFLTRGLTVTGGVAAAGIGGRPADADTRDRVRVLRTVEAASAGGHYTPNRAPLRPAPFLKLPPGSVRPRGWLRRQLDLQVEGLNGRMPEVSDYLVYDTNGWVDPAKGGWEELPYWLRGFTDLGLVTGDERVRSLTRRWVDGILATQLADGWFGPAALRTSLEGGPDFWPHMPVLDALRSYAEATGDERITPFLMRYFDFQNRQPAEVFRRGWGAYRWGDTIDSVYWAYNRTGDGRLLDLVRKIHAGSADYVTGLPTPHNVNLAQGFREPAQYGVLAGDPALRAATYRDYDTVMGTYGQFPGGGFAGDENCRPYFTDPRQGLETCGFVELMHSFELLTRITGDPVWADRCEDIAVNSLPAAFDPAQRGTHYITSANGVQLDNVAKTHGQFDNDFAMQAYMPGVHDYRCCPHNYGMGWPYYAEELWLATYDAGLCASMYAASEVTAKVGGDGTTVTVTEETGYPFEESVTLRISTPRPVEFPLYLRVPRWCEQPALRVNGSPVPLRAAPPCYVVVTRTWRQGDRVELRLPMRATTRTWEKNHGAVSVEYGPLTFSLAIEENWRRFAGTTAWPEYEVTAGSPWNYGLDGRSFSLRRRPTRGNPFTRRGAPLEIRARARRIPNWRTDDENVIRPLQDGPVRSDERAETVTLIPMGAARLRVTAFPVIGHGADARDWRLVPVASASHLWQGDTTEALCDGIEPASSGDESIPRFTWWDHRGGVEWVQYDHPEPITAAATAVYWFDDTGHGQCRVPVSWRLLYRDGDTWTPVENPSAYGTARDTYNRTTFTPVRASAFRLEARLGDGVSGGILEWRVDQV
ncbi:beta-L-arabinofuranosidase domain-containing protein [Actinoallomurus sp. NPDC052274]|uniref:beta-L-arabinofuranosidase domain-containing protein n=1 Tax=Actinoallomurus sp. NPDC052274 TaxID=3155420 RepID=UPI003445FE50